jgi:hypothetical protein
MILGNVFDLRKPDAVISMVKPFDVPASGTIDYKYFEMPTNFTEDKWVQMAELRPGNRAAVHHAVVYIREPGSTWLRDAQSGVPYVPPGSTHHGRGSARLMAICGPARDPNRSSEPVDPAAGRPERAEGCLDGVQRGIGRGRFA